MDAPETDAPAPDQLFIAMRTAELSLTPTGMAVLLAKLIEDNRFAKYRRNFAHSASLSMRSAYGSQEHKTADAAFVLTIINIARALAEDEWTRRQ